MCDKDFVSLSQSVVGWIIIQLHTVACCMFYIIQVIYEPRCVNQVTAERCFQNELCRLSGSHKRRAVDARCKGPSPAVCRQSAHFLSSLVYCVMRRPLKYPQWHGGTVLFTNVCFYFSVECFQSSIFEFVIFWLHAYALYLMMLRCYMSLFILPRSYLCICPLVSSVCMVHCSSSPLHIYLIFIYF